MPNLCVYRPADAVETAECWQLALEDRTRPSALALTRQNLAQVRQSYSEENLCARGAYALDGDEDAEVSLFASGSEVGVAVAAKAALAERGIVARVVSAPCFERFFEQDAAYQEATLGAPSLRVGIEAAVRQGWDAIIGAEGIFVGMHGFGASGPGEELFRHFGITAEAVVEKVVERLGRSARKTQKSRRRM
jgi:transketolase